MGLSSDGSAGKFRSRLTEVLSAWDSGAEVRDSHGKSVLDGARQGKPMGDNRSGGIALGLTLHGKYRFSRVYTQFRESSCHRRRETSCSLRTLSLRRCGSLKQRSWRPPWGADHACKDLRSVTTPAIREEYSIIISYGFLSRWMCFHIFRPSGKGISRLRTHWHLSIEIYVDSSGVVLPP